MDFQTTLRGVATAASVTFRIVAAAAGVLLGVAALLLVAPFGLPLLGIPLAAVSLALLFRAVF